MSGQKVDLCANYFVLDRKPDWCLYQYRVDFRPEIASKRIRIAMVKGQASITGNTSAFDGQTLYLPFRLPDDITTYTAKRQYDSTPVEITIKLTNELPPADPACIQMFNVIFRRDLNIIGMNQIGRHYFNPKLKIEIPNHSVEIWPGYATSIAEYEDGVVLLCADVSHKLLRTRSVLQVLYDIFQSNRGGFKEEATKTLVGEIVLTKYNNKTYRIDDIDWDMNPSSTFPKKDGTQISIVDYYKKQHDLQIADDQQPMLVSRPKARDKKAGQTEPFKLVPEFCLLTGMSDRMRSDFRVMKDIAEHTRIGPQDRTERLNGLVRELSSNAEVQKEMKGWGLHFAQSLLRLQGRVLPTEQINQINTQYSYKPDTADWSSSMRGAKLIGSVSLERWILIFTNRDSSLAEAFCNTMKRVGPPMGINVADPRTCPLSDDRVDTYTRTIQTVLSQTQNAQIVVCIVSNNNKSRYDAIKKICCVENPVPSQVIVSRTLGKNIMSVATKIAIQMNCKLGGQAWALQFPFKGTMICGFDSYHDSAKRGQSVGAFVASFDPTHTRYYSRCLFQSQMQELHDGLKVCIQASLRKFAEVNGQAPERVVVYRDGVGDGQLEQVYNYEIKQITEAFKDFQKGYQPKFGLIVVKKRINTRLFQSSPSGFRNPLPGTIVDTGVTRPNWYDFFIVSQSVRQGTVSPTHYNVIHDTLGYSPDNVQRLTYKMTHLYYNWPGTIRVPAPCQYAHKLAFLVGQSLHKEPAHDLADKLYYL